MHPSNWKESDGNTTDRVRVLPTFEIVQLPNGMYGVKDETTGRMSAYGIATPGECVRLFNSQAQRRVGGL